MIELYRLDDRCGWRKHELNRLRAMIGLELPMSYIARKLGRPEENVRQQAHRVAMADMLNVRAS